MLSRSLREWMEIESGTVSMSPASLLVPSTVYVRSHKGSPDLRNTSSNNLINWVANCSCRKSSPLFTITEIISALPLVSPRQRLINATYPSPSDGLQVTLCAVASSCPPTAHRMHPLHTYVRQRDMTYLCAYWWPWVALVDLKGFARQPTRPWSQTCPTSSL